MFSFSTGFSKAKLPEQIAAEKKELSKAFSKSLKRQIRDIDHEVRGECLCVCTGLAVRVFTVGGRFLVRSRLLPSPPLPHTPFPQPTNAHTINLAPRSKLQ